MDNPLHAHHYADAALERRVAILANDAIAEDTYRVRVACPEIAQRVVPGQFLMVRIAGCDDPLIGRALAVFDLVADASEQFSAIDLIYHVKGKFTKRLASQLPGQALDVWGPLGNGFSPLECQRLVMVAGGVGHTPFLTLAKEHLGQQRYGTPPRTVTPVSQVTLCLGAQTQRFLAGVEDFRGLPLDVQLATDDGSVGHRGLVTDLLEAILARGTEGICVVSCGPVAMMQRCAEITAEQNVPCYVSLETPMACGIGICFTCVARIRDDAGAWDYKRTCVEGPVFDARKIAW